MSKVFVDRVKHSLKCLMSCTKVLDSDNFLATFSEGVMNFYDHCCKDKHASVWCKYCVEKNDDRTQHKRVCAEQSQAFYKLLHTMSGRP